MRAILIANLIDWSESFVDENGSFYCGTTDEQKRNAAKIAELADLVIDTTDLHPVTAPEHNINGGLYPVHNAVLPESYREDFVYCKTPNGESRLGNKTLSPRLTKIIAESLRDRKGGIIVPRGVYFQGGLKVPFCKPEDIEKTFDRKIVSIEEFLRGEINYVIAPKQYFDATRIDSDVSLPDLDFKRVPRINYNVFSLLKKRFPGEEYRMIFVNTGVVEGICRLHSSIGLRQMFPFDRVINIADATTPLYGVGLGYKTADESREACRRVCKDIGVEYKTTDNIYKILGERE